LKKARTGANVNAADEPSTLDPDLARPPSLSGAVSDIFAFRLAGRGYGLPAAAIELVAPAQAPIPVPTVPPHVRGVVHLRGRILTVIDLAVVLGLDGAAGDERDRRLVVVAADPHPYAFRADLTLGVRHVAAEDTTPPGETPEDGVLIRGRFTDGGHVISILDPSALLGRLLAAGGEVAP
jgi:purine-binding chemotaxis protein CheW